MNVLILQASPRANGNTALQQGKRHNSSPPSRMLHRPKTNVCFFESRVLYFTERAQHE